MRKAEPSESGRKVDPEELGVSGWLDRLDPEYWVRSGRVGTGEARKASAAMMWMRGSEDVQGALTMADAVCKDRTASPMERRLAGVAALAAWTALGKSPSWLAGDGETVGCDQARLVCTAFDEAWEERTGDDVKSLAHAAFKGLMAGRERLVKERDLAEAGLPVSSPAGELGEASVWEGFDPERMRSRLNGACPASASVPAQMPAAARFAAAAHPVAKPAKGLAAPGRVVAKSIETPRAARAKRTKEA